MNWKDKMKKAEPLPFPKYVNEYLDLIERIAELIDTQAPLKAQKAWLKEVMDRGIYQPK
tara:strand:+ start:454 stop:630 length:177 start_codon:yes stop_codon:yes gene_type:complete